MPFHEAVAIELRAGDVLLKPMRCYVCEAIEREEESIYSHSAVVVPDETGTVRVVEAFYERVAWTTLDKFRSTTQRGQRIRVVRPREFSAIGEEGLRVRLEEVFATRFEGLPVDETFLWSNADESGREKLYCSEFVSKFLNSVLARPIATKPMHFSRMASFWQTYFRGVVPEGEPGVSPGDLERWNGAETVGELD